MLSLANIVRSFGCSARAPSVVAKSVRLMSVGGRLTSSRSGKYASLAVITLSTFAINAILTWSGLGGEGGGGLAVGGSGSSIGIGLGLGGSSEGLYKNKQVKKKGQKRNKHESVFCVIYELFDSIKDG